MDERIALRMKYGGRRDPVLLNELPDFLDFLSENTFSET
jgi:hypothetical protein